MNLQEQPLVSVVTPVYNGEEYLAECIESVLAQTYQNWEYVIVNNCSTDRSLEIAQRYARRDRRIRVHNNDELLPIIPNWNHALRQMSDKSKYCKVVHADDLLFPECLTRMVQVAEEHPSVGIVAAYALYGKEVRLDGLPYPSTVMPGHEICRISLLEGRNLFGSPTCHMVRSDLIRRHESFYDEAELHADTDVCFRLLKEVDYGFVHQVLTYNRKHDKSVTSSYAQQFYTFRAARLARVKKYGPIYLSRKEYKTCLRRELARYYRQLGRSLLQRRDRELYAYQRDELDRIGEPLQVGRLATVLVKTGALQLMTRLANPRRTIRRMLRKPAPSR